MSFQVTEEALKMYADLLESLDESERGKLQRSMGLKMEQLKVGIFLRACKCIYLTCTAQGSACGLWHGLQCCSSD